VHVSPLGPTTGVVASVKVTCGPDLSSFAIGSQDIGTTPNSTQKILSLTF
jgi:hypothetical protein